MSDLLVRKLDDDDKERLRRRAARNGRSMEAEARGILKASLISEVLEGDAPLEGLGTRLARLFEGVSVDLDPYIQTIRGQAPRPAVFDVDDE